MEFVNAIEMLDQRPEFRKRIISESGETCLTFSPLSYKMFP